jgi:hypothetical protein
VGKLSKATATIETIRMQTEETSKATPTPDEEGPEMIQTEIGSSVITASYKATDRKNVREQSVKMNLTVTSKAGYIGQECL